MKNLTLLIALLFIIPAVSAQSEFKTYQNGLIYDTTTMYHLGVIVDSLNLKFNACDLDHPYFSIPQGRAHYVKVPKAAKKLIEAGISLEDFRKKYPKAVKQENIYIIKYEYENYYEENVVEYEGLPGAKGPSIVLQNTAANNKTSGWVMEDDHAFYLINLTSTTLPESYARLIQYVDCMIDTTAQIFLPAAKGDTYQQVDSGSIAYDFIAWAEDFPDRPTLPNYFEDDQDLRDSLRNSYWEHYPTWDSLRLLALDEKYANTPYRQQQLLRARDEAIAMGNTDADLEFYVSRYLTKKDALNMKRSRKVYGACSMDDSPRVHAAEICMLAAETYQWDIFLRSHMNIMNDRFERMTDGSYAQAGRKTYLKELEALGINAPDLLLGTCLRAKNVSSNHYYGSIGRIGRALAETNDNDGVEGTIFNILQNDEVDSFNRLLFAYLFSHYNYNLADTVRSTRNEARFKKLRKELPSEIEQVLAAND